jgi:hypothetical protein
MDEERGSRDQNHENGPRPADRPVRERPLGDQKLYGAETDRHEGESGVKRYDRWGVEQRGERHDPILVGEFRGLDRDAGRPKRAWP